MRLLIAEDHAPLRTSLAEVATARGFEVREADTFEAAVLALALFDPELCLIDFHLGSYLHNGRSLAQFAKRIRPDRRVVLMSGLIAPDCEQEVEDDPMVDV